MNTKYFIIGALLVSISSQVAFASIDHNLKYGQKNSSVLELQEFLIDKGFLQTQSKGFFGLLTLKAVKAYQTSLGLPSTGYVGSLTREKINNELVALLQPSTQAEAQEVKQTVQPTTTQVVVAQSSSNDSATNLLKQQNELLQKQLAEQQKILQATNQIISNTTPPAPQPQPQPWVSKPTEISIQTTPCNLSSTNLKAIYNIENLLSYGNTDGRIFMNAYVLNQEKQNYYNDNPSDVMTITTSNHSNDKTLNGSGNTGPCGYYYPYEFYTTSTGTYTVTFSVNGLQKSVTVQVQ